MGTSLLQFPPRASQRPRLRVVRVSTERYQHAGAELVGILQVCVETMTHAVRGNPVRDLTKSVSPSRGRNFSDQQLFAAFAAAASHPELPATAWRTVRARINGWLDALNNPPAVTYPDAWRVETADQAAADLAQHEALRSNDPAVVRAAMDATLRNVASAQQVANALRVRLAELTPRAS